MVVTDNFSVFNFLKFNEVLIHFVSSVAQSV